MYFTFIARLYLTRVQCKLYLWGIRGLRASTGLLLLQRSYLETHRDESYWSSGNYNYQVAVYCLVLSIYVIMRNVYVWKCGQLTYIRSKQNIFVSHCSNLQALIKYHYNFCEINIYLVIGNCTNYIPISWFKIKFMKVLTRPALRRSSNKFSRVFFFAIMHISQ